MLEADCDGKVTMSLAQIQEFLTCTRPCCRRPVSEIDGCLASFCPECRVYFCIICDSIIPNGNGVAVGHQDTAHKHVSECSKTTFNLEKGMLFPCQHPQGAEGAKKALQGHFALRLLKKFESYFGNQVIPFESPFG